MKTLWIAIVAALAVFVVAFANDWRLPGLYMDAVNPEYIIPGIFDRSAPGHRPWILPGNELLSRFPLFTGQIYHGSAQLYFALPFMALLGVDIGTFRVVQGLVGCLILLSMALYAGRSSAGAKGVMAASSMVLLALDPSFVMALRTQAYSCLFPLILLLPSVLLLRDWGARPRPGLRLFVSGCLFGLAVFSYFIFAFFLPALVWMLIRERGAGRPYRGLREGALWPCGSIVGYLPFLCGMFLLADQLGGGRMLVHWLHNHSDKLHVMGANTGVFDRMLAVFTDARSLFTGKWPWLMILGHHAGDALGSLKAGLLVAVPILALAVVPKTQADDKRAIRAPLLFALSFLAFASIFGERLDGHHYTAILPFSYAALGLACAALWSVNREQRITGVAHMSVRDAACASLAAISLLGIAGMNLFNLLHFHRDLRASGGAGFYSDAIDRFSLDVQKNDPDATVYLPDWGYVMPFTFLTRARVAQIDSVDPQRIARETCAGKAQIVVFTGSANASKFDVVRDLAGQPDPTITLWSQRDGIPVFQSARFAPRTDCPRETETASAAPATTGDGPSIDIAPGSSSACEFLSPVTATVRWDAKEPALERAEVWIEPIGGTLKLWTAGGARGQDRTGPWALPGMKFILIDGVTHEHLAATEIGKIPCPSQ